MAAGARIWFAIRATGDRRSCASKIRAAALKDIHSTSCGAVMLPGRDRETGDMIAEMTGVTAASIGVDPVQGREDGDLQPSRQLTFASHLFGNKPNAVSGHLTSISGERLSMTILDGRIGCSADSMFAVDPGKRVTATPAL